jgi:hypothetical protein
METVMSKLNQTNDVSHNLESFEKVDLRAIGLAEEGRWFNKA